MRAVALLLAVIAVLLLGHALYETIQFGFISWVSVLLALLVGACSLIIFRRFPGPASSDEGSDEG